MSYPSHFHSAKNFNMFILECAINDRISWIDCYSNAKNDPEYMPMLNEANEEIKEMKKRLRHLKNKSK